MRDKNAFSLSKNLAVSHPPFPSPHLIFPFDGHQGWRLAVAREGGTKEGEGEFPFLTVQQHLRAERKMFLPWQKDAILGRVLNLNEPRDQGKYYSYMKHES